MAYPVPKVPIKYSIEKQLILSLALKKLLILRKGGRSKDEIERADKSKVKTAPII